MGGEEVQVEGVDFAVAGEIAGAPQGVGLLLPAGGEEVEVEGVYFVVEGGVAEEGLGDEEGVVVDDLAAEGGEVEVGVVGESEGSVG